MTGLCRRLLPRRSPGLPRGCLSDSLNRLGSVDLAFHAPKIPASLSVEDMLLTTGSDVHTINVIDSNGRVTGKIDRTQAIETVRQTTPGQSG